MDGWTSRAKLADALRGGTTPTTAPQEADRSARSRVRPSRCPTRVNRFELIEKPAAATRLGLGNEHVNSQQWHGYVRQPMNTDNETDSEVGGVAYNALSQFDNRHTHNRQYNQLLQRSTYRINCESRRVLTPLPPHTHTRAHIILCSV